MMLTMAPVDSERRLDEHAVTKALVTFELMVTKARRPG